NTKLIIRQIMSEEIVPTSSKLAFGGITFVVGIFSNLVIATSFTYFYNVKLGLDESWTGLAWLIFIVWNTINDPLLGFIEDRTKSAKYGRRVPYIRFGGLIYAVLFILSWIPFATSANQISLFFNMLIMLFLFDTLFTMTGLISYSLPAEMAITNSARSKLNVFGSIGNALALLFSFVIPTLLLTGDEPASSDPNFPVFLITILVLGIVGAIIIFVSSFYIKENKYTILEEPLGFKASIVETFKNRAFLIFEISQFCFLIAQFILTNGVLYWVDGVLGLSGLLGILPLLVFFLVVFLFFPIYSKLIIKYGIKKVFTGLLIFTGISFIISFLIGWNLYTSFIAMILIGIGISGYFLTSQLVMAEVIDNDEILTGKRRETTYSGMNALLTKPTNSIGPWILLSVISLFGFDNTPGAVQTEFAKMGIMIAFTVIPAILILLSALIIKFFPLSGPEWSQKKEELHKIHQEKEKSYLEHIKSQEGTKK
ncbi:MAG: MFS transporter, partial [Candidatus Hermodarchaeota archaeon]